MKLSTAIQKWSKKGLTRDEIELKARAAVKKAGGRWSKGMQAMVDATVKPAKHPALTKQTKVTNIPLDVAVKMIIAAGKLPSKGTPDMVIQEAKKMFGKKYDAALKEAQAAQAGRVMKPAKPVQEVESIGAKKTPTVIKPALMDTAKPVAGGAKPGRSVGISLHPLAQAMYRGLALGKRSYGNKSKVFPAENKMCKYFFDNYDSLVADLPILKEMKSIINSDSEAVDDFIKSNGKGKSSAEKNAYEVFIGTIFELLLQWKMKGSKYNIKGGFQGVKMPETGAAVVGGKVLTVKAKNGDIACMMEVPKLLNAEGAFQAALDAMKKFPAKQGEACIGYFPKINMKANGRFNWMLNTYIGTAPSADTAWKVFGCSTENILKMDEVGAHIKSEVKVSMMTKGIERKPKEFKIENPFLFWVVRKGCTFPIFAAYLSKDSWVKGGK